MASGTKNGADEIAPSEVSVSVGKGVRMPDFNAAEVVDFAAEACDIIVALGGNGRKRRPTSRVDVLIASNTEMRRLNRDFRHKDRPTDVLSFPVAESNGHALEGDIAISAEITAQNASRLRHAVTEELKILILHGMLHLAGYDHATDRGQMARLERALRHALQLPGSLIQRELRSAGRPARRSRAKRRKTRSAR